MRGRILPAGALGARLMVGRLTLDQLVEVRILCPQPGKDPLSWRVFSFVRVRIPTGGTLSFAPSLKALLYRGSFLFPGVIARSVSCDEAISV
jgi:hypothetical protein